MGAKIIDGKGIAAEIRAGLAKKVSEFKAKRGFVPGLAVVLVGDDPASQVYVRNKGKACVEVGINSFEHRLPADTSDDRLIGLVRELNGTKDVHGILVQLPLPRHMDEQAVIEAISPEKDVDGFHPYNVGRLAIGKPTLMPCTPYGIIKLLEHTGIDLSGKDAVIVGRSNIVGKPVAFMLLRKNATVTVCHSRTTDLVGKVSSADVVVAAIGAPEFIKGEWIKPGAVVIDVGINRVSGGLVGDVEYKGAFERASYITPVPGGVGPMTIAMLLTNTLEAATASAALL